MKVPVARFFRFCATHEILIRELSNLGDEEVTENRVRELIREVSLPDAESEEVIFRNLTDLQILTPLSSGAESMIVAPQLVQLVRYLVDEARPATPQVINGYIESLTAVTNRIDAALEACDPDSVKYIMTEVRNILTRIIRDVEETRETIVREVMAFRRERSDASVKGRFRQIVYWLDHYAEPMAALVRVDGPMEVTFAEVERILQKARVSIGVEGSEQSLKLLRTVTRHSWHVFDQCLKELRPLYESLVRSNLIATGAAYALERLSADRIKNWGGKYLVGVMTFRHQSLLSDTAIHAALRRVFEYQPKPPPVILPAVDVDTSEAIRRYKWLNTLPEKISENLPVPDLCEFLANDRPDLTAGDILCGVAKILFNPKFTADFSGRSPRIYSTNDAKIEAHPVEVTAP